MAVKHDNKRGSVTQLVWSATLDMNLPKNPNDLSLFFQVTKILFNQTNKKKVKMEKK